MFDLYNGLGMAPLVSEIFLTVNTVVQSTVNMAFSQTLKKLIIMSRFAMMNLGKVS